MGTILLLVVVMGVVLFVIGRVSSPAKQMVSSRRADADAPMVHEAVAGGKPAASAASSPALPHRSPSGVVRPPVLTADQRQALRDIQRQRAQERQRDNRMAAAAGVAGVVAGAALMHHLDAKETQAHIDQAAAMQRDALAEQDDGFDDGGSDTDYADRDWDDIDDDVDWDADWSVDDDEDYGDAGDDGSSDDYDGYGYGDSSDYGGDDYGGGYDDYGGSYDDGGYDGGDGGDGGDFF